jgi:hypothetical protein
MPATARFTLSAIAGAAVGYFCLAIAANAEDWQFYTLRSYITGRTAMSEIVHHPTDRWVMAVLLAVSILGGAVAGVLAARWFEPGTARRG